jgi:hypothetical protein
MKWIILTIFCISIGYLCSNSHVLFEKKQTQPTTEEKFYRLFQEWKEYDTKIHS